MTFFDTMIKLAAWFMYGFGIVSMMIGIANFGMILVTVITVKGIDIPLWAIPALGTIVIVFCTAVGYFFKKYGIWEKITSYNNTQTNPEIKQVCQDVKDIKKHLGLPP
jgi:hypothetical protein